VLEAVPFVHLLDLHIIYDLGVDLCGFQVGMAQQLADHFHRDPDGDAHGGKGMTGAMEGDEFLQMA